MERRFIATWPASLMVLLPLTVLVSHAAAEGTVRVGVILDLVPVTGTRLKTSIQMAVEDYYSAHPNSTTRIELHLGLVRRCCFGTVSAAVDLIKNAQRLMHQNTIIV